MEEEFERVVTKISTPLVRRQKGLVACYARKPTGSTPDKFAMVSVWTDIAPLKAFTVGRWHQAVIPDRS
jgi:heme-degrading monooxygenase HmoA